MNGDRVRVRRVVIVKRGVVYTRCVGKGKRPLHPAPQLQDIHDIEGERALRGVAQRWFHGYVH